ncbi:right-handed parallel beta-helix repeat-containing protein [Haliangium sp. UPWRP_2]|uniref:right-handed parallel beta-helix repeat-containing protein n=1 Tax=Haliangium sp. UPWRP_2 TaxID=1931276 RepID=UPI000B54574C|nr:right-handed parallel beta-helix repeat-containing protein [Haliangium sp. UPWRP_2]PSM31072.1 hypothetical protein BVG81_007270 [Haliangium sp. UPWRP_2]
MLHSSTRLVCSPLPAAPRARHPADLARRGALALGLGLLALGGSADAATLQVGPGKTYGKPCQAIAAAAAGDVIEIDAAGNYTGDTCAFSTDNLTLRGVNGRPKIDITGTPPAQKKGIYAITAPNATIENLELSGAAISMADGNNGAGIRHQGTNLTVRGCYFHDNQNGILGAPPTGGTGQVLIEYSEFENNGAGDGFSHNMYIGNYAVFTLQHSYSHRGKVGHLVKTRAIENRIWYNRITDENGTASYEIDIPDAGLSYVIGNLLEQSSGTQNPAILSYAAESTGGGRDTHLYVVNNTFLNNKKSGSFVNNASATPSLLRNNIFMYAGTITAQSGAQMSGNFVNATQGDPMFVNVAAYDVRLQAGSPCIDTAVDPGSAGSQSLAPVWQYLHPVSRQSRAVIGAATDVGAYEFGNQGTADGGTGGTGGSDGGTGSEADGGTGGTGGTTPTGCSCQLGGAHSPSPSPLALLLPVIGLGLGLVLRRQRSPQRA